MTKCSSSLDLPREDSCFDEHGEAVLGRLKLALVRDEAVDAPAQPDLAVAGQHAGRRLSRVARHIPTRRLQGASGPSGYYPMNHDESKYFSIMFHWCYIEKHFRSSIQLGHRHHRPGCIGCRGLPRRCRCRRCRRCSRST